MEGARVVNKISVIIPVYKAEKYFERCLRSLFNQSLKEIEYIFVNDCTPDKSFDILNNIIKEYPERESAVKLIMMSSNVKQAAARQAGLEIATGDYVIHCDPDDWIDLTYYEDLYTKAVEEYADIVVGDYIVHDGNGHSIKCTNKNYNEPIDIILSNDCFFTSLCMSLISKDVIKKNNINFFPNINCMEDQGFISRVVYFANKIEFTHSSYYHYNKENSESITHFLSSSSVIDQRVKCLELIDDFYVSKGISPLRLGLSLRVKRDIKDQFLSLDMLERWRDLFPEVIDWEWQNSEGSLLYKICYYCSHKIGLWPMKLYLAINGIKRKIK